MWKKTVNSNHILKNVSRQVLPFQKDSVFETELTIFIQRNEMYAKEDYQYLSPFKKCIPTSMSMPKKCSVWNWIFFFSIKGTKCMWKKTNIFCHFLKNVTRQVLPCQKTSVFKNEYNFFNQRNEKYVKEDYQLLSSFKNWIPTSTSMPKNFSVCNWIHFFQLRKEMYVEEDCQFLSHFKKCITTSTSVSKNFSV